MISITKELQTELDLKLDFIKWVIADDLLLSVAEFPLMAVLELPTNPIYNPVCGCKQVPPTHYLSKGFLCSVKTGSPRYPVTYKSTHKDRESYYIKYTFKIDNITKNYKFIELLKYNYNIPISVVVHHWDYNPFNNHPSNLFLMTTSLHSRYHNRLRVLAKVSYPIEETRPSMHEFTLELFNKFIEERE